MKKLLLPILCLALAACGEKKAQTSYADLAGEWLNVKYIDAIAQTKSPIDAQKTVGLAEIIFHEDMADIIINLHEGAQGKLDSLGDGKFSVTIDNIAYNVSLKNDTVSVNEDRFVRLPEGKTINTAFVNKLLAGKYQSADGKSTIELTEDGQMVGCPTLRDYYIYIDYYGDENMKNLVDFTSTDGQSIRYTWTIDGQNVVFTNIPYQIDELMDKPVVGENFTLVKVS